MLQGYSKSYRYDNFNRAVRAQYSKYAYEEYIYNEAEELVKKSTSQVETTYYLDDYELVVKKDKDKFLEILCKSGINYKVNVHDYCLMDNHYHLLVQTTSSNLSLFMRQINSNYAIYFNKKYKRSGHLWQGRYKSYYIIEERYLYTLFKYIEHNQ